MTEVATRRRSEPVDDLSHIPVQDLTARMVAGHEQSFRDFYDQYFPRLFGYLLVLTNGNADQADELLQQTLIKVAAKVRVFQDDQQFWAWLAKIARNIAYDHGRHRKRYLALLERFWHGRADPAPIIKDETSFNVAIAEAITTLEPDERQILQLKYEEGLSVKEIAETLNATEKAIESRLSRLRAELKKRTLEALKNANS